MITTESWHDNQVNGWYVSSMNDSGYRDFEN